MAQHSPQDEVQTRIDKLCDEHDHYADKVRSIIQTRGNGNRTGFWQAVNARDRRYRQLKELCGDKASAALAERRKTRAAKAASSTPE